MEIHPTWIIILGLGLDILGAVLIVGPIRNSKNMSKHVREFSKELFEVFQKAKEGSPEEITPETNRKRIDQLAHGVNERLLEELKGYTKLILGIVFLVIGFILQIIGNWWQNPPF